LYVTNRPEEHRDINAAELALIRPKAEFTDGRHRQNLSTGRPPWARMFSSVSVWGLLLSYTFRAYTMYFFDTWFFTYLIGHLRDAGVGLFRSGLWGSTPYLAILLLSPVGGWVSDVAVSKFGKRRGRQIAVWLGMTFSAGLVWTGSHTANNALAILLVASAAGFNMFATISWWATCIDVTPNYAGSLSGLMNMCGGIGGWLAPILTAYIATSFGWERALDLIAILSLAAGLLWFLVNADERIEDEVPPLPAGSVGGSSGGR
jgi:ACS family glucarate transporter-like MFS transporter